MSKDNRIQMPSSQGGLTRFDGSTGSRFQLTPTAVIILGAGVIAVVIAMHSFLR